METKEKDIFKSAEKKMDFVNHPQHYNGHEITTASGSFGYETIDLITSVVDRLVKDGVTASAAYCIGNALKYIERCGEKPGDYGKDQKRKNAEECKKAAWYLNRAAAILES